jgi:Ni,Fe-hydrogenase III small subunit
MNLTRTLLLSVLVLASGLALACGGSGDGGVEAETVGSAAELSPTDLGTLGARLHQSPQEADAILESEGLTWEEFEAAVRQVSADVGDAEAYAEAFEAGGGTQRAPGA